MSRTRVALVYGGKSGEHEVSLVSAYSILEALDPTHFDVVAIGIDRDGQWYFNQLPDLLADMTERQHHQLSAKLSTSKAITITEAEQTKEIIGGPIDVVFPIIHGTLGEDGCLQGFLEMADLPYVGAGVLASAIGMDKDVAKRLAHLAGAKTAPYKAYTKAVFDTHAEKIVSDIIEHFGTPVFVKPACLGSSVGIHKATDHDTLYWAIQDAFKYDEKIVIEQFIDGREIEVSVLENPIPGEPPLVSVPGEIRPGNKHGFYSYEAKYIDPNGAELIIPAELSKEKIEEIQYEARTIFTALTCESMARVDFFLERSTGRLLFNEINTIPGFTPISMYPKLWESSGLPYKELLRMLIDLAIARHRRKKSLQVSYTPKGK